MKDWYSHVGRMLTHVNDMLHPHRFEDIVKDDFAALRQIRQEKRRRIERAIAHGSREHPDADLLGRNPLSSTRRALCNTARVRSIPWTNTRR